MVAPIRGEPGLAPRSDGPFARAAGLVPERSGELDERLAHGGLVPHAVVYLGRVLTVV